MLNPSSKHKMVAPSYQELGAEGLVHILRMSCPSLTLPNIFPESRLLTLKAPKAPLKSRLSVAKVLASNLPFGLWVDVGTSTSSSPRNQQYSMNCLSSGLHSLTVSIRTKFWSEQTLTIMTRQQFLKVPSKSARIQKSTKLFIPLFYPRTNHRLV